jgi:hypothetical protein
MMQSAHTTFELRNINNATNNRNERYSMSFDVRWHCIFKYIRREEKKE